MKLTLSITTAFILIAGTTALAAVPVKRANTPAISPDGSLVMFSWQGDIWSAPAEGGQARRLTVHPAMDRAPIFIPGTNRVVFASNRSGNFNLYSMTIDGGDVKRLTFDSASMIPYSVSQDGEWVYGHTNLWGRIALFKAPTAGGDLVRLSPGQMEIFFFPSVSRDGTRVAFQLGGGSRGWMNPHAKGTSAGSIWSSANTTPLSDFSDRTPELVQNLFPVYGPGNVLYFVSNRNGWPNIYRQSADGRNTRQVTRLENFTIRHPSLSQDGRMMVAEFGPDLIMIDTENGNVRTLEFTVPTDERTNPRQEISMNSGLSGYAVSPDGKRAVVELRGNLFLIPSQGGTTRRITFNDGLDSNPVWLDDRNVLYVASDKGRRTLRVVSVDGESRPFVTDTVDVYSPSLSPDRKTVAYVRGRDEIRTIPVTGGTPTTVVRGNFATAMDGDPVFTWSPDGRWLVYQVPNQRSATVQMVRLSDRRTIDVARTPRGGGLPKFLPNGRGVYFTASDAGTNGLWVVDLVPTDITFTEDDLDRIDDPQKKEETKEVTIQVREEGLMERMRRIATGVSGDPLASPDSRNIWVNVGGQLQAVNVLTGASSPVAGVTGSAGGLDLASGRLFFVQQGRLYSMALNQPQPRQVNFNAVFDVNIREENEALFHEIWATLGRGFYDDTFHGKDWQQIRTKYAAMVPYVTDRTDFYLLMSEMMEELDSSHLGGTAPPEPTFDNESTGFLGVEFDPEALARRSAYIVSSVMPGSPASHPQTELKVGDRLLRVNGTAINQQNPLGELLFRTAGRRTVIEVERNGLPVRVEIRPSTRGGLANLVYENWVRQNREYVERASNGKLTYLHIQGMNEPSLQQFLREIRTLTPGREGVIIDVRFNGGGSTAHQILSVLNKEPWLIRTTPGEFGYNVSENIWRGDSLELPTALLINENSFSNAEIFAEGFRRMRLGPIIGEATAGGVIGTSAYRLWDGGSIRMPRIGAYAIDGENLERNGRRPDIRVPFDPNAAARGEDPQLDRAIAEMMKRVPKG